MSAVERKRLKAVAEPYGLTSAETLRMLVKLKLDELKNNPF